MRRSHLSALLASLALAACTEGGPSAPVDAGHLAPDVGTDAGPPVCETAGSTLGAACTATHECDDGCFCNGVELCSEGVCVAGEAPCADEHACTDDVCDERARTCSATPHDDRCDDGVFCNGFEVCDFEFGCLGGLPPSCADGDPCTTSACDPALDACVHAARDLDGDGAADDRCGGDDCDDDPTTGALASPDQPEQCGNGRDDDCDGRIDFYQDDCTAPNDDCASAELLPGPGTFVRTTLGATDDVPLACAPTGNDVVFRVRLDRSQDVSVAVVPEVGSAAVAVRPFGACESGPELACAAGAAIARNLAPGDYAIVVRSGSASRFELTVSYAAPTPVGSTDLCQASAVDVSGGGTFTGLFANTRDDYALSCRPTATSRDAAYRLELTETSDVTLIATTTGGGATSTYLALTRDCYAPATTLACVQRASAEIVRRTLEPGTYYVLLESAAAAATSWTLSVDVRPAIPRNDGDACTTAVDITNTTATLPLSMLSLDTGTTCGGAPATSRDASFTFSTTAEQDVVLHTTVGSPHFLAVSRTCGDLRTEIFCTSGTPTIDHRFVRLPAGTYHVTVSTSVASGDLTASARIEPPTTPPTNDTCASASTLEDAVPLRSDLTAASDDVASCGGAGARDTLHRFVLTERREVTLIARRTDGSGELLSLGLRGACEGTTDLACAPGAPAVLSRTLDPGTYYAVVESSPAAAGSYALTLYLAAP
ncbi:hypothetical protein [Sandaracinus amylolyticus]|uniref:hypothetical protein n=1 Tax=Sandaracinus amylolyticus TaxID=927083 RepID=UPI001F300136|nr:hypothetical protein [Sandaracinus amylolyticus]UJR83089.1 Hypothetical protein I5071_51550 [Sandaracinus amylolyticus]